MKKITTFLACIIVSGCTFSQVITTIIGNGTNSYSGDGGLASAAGMRNVNCVQADNLGNIYFSEFGRVRKITPDGMVNTIAGQGQNGCTAEGVLATNTFLQSPGEIAIDTFGGVLFTQEVNCQVHNFLLNGNLQRITGGKGCGYTNAGYSGDGSYAINAKISQIASIHVSKQGITYLADTYNYRIRKIQSGIITTISGTGTNGYTGDGGSAAYANVSVGYLTTDNSGNIYFSSGSYNVIRKINSSGIISTIAGSASGNYDDSIPAIQASLITPQGLCVDNFGNLYFAERDLNRVRKISPDGIITTIAGTGTAGYSGDGGSATSAMLNQPRSVSLDSLGNLYVVDAGNNRIRKIKLLTSQPTHYFRSVVSGSWSSPITWESSPVVDFSSGLVSPATLFPNQNAKGVVVNSSHNITLTTSLAVTNLKISPGGNILVKSGVNLTVK